MTSLKKTIIVCFGQTKHAQECLEQEWKNLHVCMRIRKLLETELLFRTENMFHKFSKKSSIKTSEEKY